jgi:DNA-binding HxlR family transcriptional regulator
MKKDLLGPKLDMETRGKKISEYANRVDPLIKRAICSLDDEKKFAIIALLKDGDRSFSQLMDELGLDQSTLRYHLKKLSFGGIIENYYQKRTDTTEYSFYKLSEFGRDLLSKLSELVSVLPVFSAKEQSIVYQPRESEVVF